MSWVSLILGIIEFLKQVFKISKKTEAQKDADIDKKVSEEHDRIGNGDRPTGV